MNKLFLLLLVTALTFYGDAPPCNQSPEASGPPVSCESLERGMGLPSGQKCYPPAYNAPANISVKDGWDFNLFASFLYWHVSQEGMNTAVELPVLDVSTGTLTSPSFLYKPGFKVGFGFDTNYDNWTGSLEYTWMHQKTYHTSHTSSTSPFSDAGWYIFGVAAPVTNATFVSAKWKMHLDMLDLAFSRPFYEGTRITIAPIAGMRGLWIRQDFKIGMDNPLFLLNPDHLSTFTMRSHSWAVGPMLGVGGHWMLGSNLRFEGKTGASILYTRYSKIEQKQSIIASNTTTLSTASDRGDLNVLRPMADLGVGMGWGSYSSCQKYYFDVSFRYDFNVLWNQNAMAEFINGMNSFPGANGNLYMHGLTASARLDF